MRDYRVTDLRDLRFSSRLGVATSDTTVQATYDPVVIRVLLRWGGSPGGQLEFMTVRNPAYDVN